MVHLASSCGDRESTARFFVHKSSSCEQSSAEKVVFLKEAFNAVGSASRAESDLTLPMLMLLTFRAKAGVTGAI